MIATPDQRNRLLQKLKGGDMYPAKERKLQMSGTDEMSQRQKEN
jgi:hypothetical protein